MRRQLPWAALALAAGLTTAQAEEPLQYGLVHGVFRAEAETAGKDAIHPLEPAQKLEALENGHTFRIGRTGPMAGEAFTFPVFAGPDAKEPAAPAGLTAEGTFIAAVDLTGSGVSDLVYGGKATGAWKVLTNGSRLPKPVQGFVAGYFEQGADSPRTDAIPSDTRDFAKDQDLLAAVGDFLGNGKEQLAFTRPGETQIWIVGAHGVLAMKADLKGVEATSAGAKNHWLFSYKANRKGQRTRLAYYRAGADHLTRLVPKGMEFAQEQVPLKGHWERLNQAVMDWPQAPAKAPEGKTAAAK